MSNENQPYGVDISSHQYSGDGSRKVNFDKLNPLITFCGVRAGISWGYTDPWYTYSKAHLLAPRLDYHVVYPGEDANRQMDHFLQITNPQEHDRLALDLELDHGYSKYRITQTTIACLERLKSETGRYPLIYSRASWVNQFLQVSDLPQVDWWLANYLKALPPPFYTNEHPGPPALPAGVNTWMIHQTGDKGNGGAHGVVSYYIDQNRWNGTEEEMLAYFGLGEEGSHEIYLPIIVKPEPEPEPVDETHDGITLWNQHDERWGKQKLGNSAYTIAQMGCLLCCHASVMKKLGYDTDPGRLNVELRRIGGFTQHRIYFLMPQRLYPKVERHYWHGYLATANFERVKELVRQGLNPMIHVDREPSVYGMQEHWIVVLEGLVDDLRVYDPYDGTIKRFTSEFGDPTKNIHRINCMRRKKG